MDALFEAEFVVACAEAAICLEELRAACADARAHLAELDHLLERD